MLSCMGSYHLPVSICRIAYTVTTVADSGHRSVQLLMFAIIPLPVVLAKFKWIGDRFISTPHGDQRLYKMINRDPTINVPYKKILMALSYMKGPKVNNWVHAYATEFEARVTGGMNANMKLIECGSNNALGMRLPIRLGNRMQ